VRDDGKGKAIPQLSIEKEVIWHGIYNLLRKSKGVALSRIEGLLFRIPESSHSIIFLEQPPK